MAHQIVDNLASGQEIPNIQIIPQSQLKADGAFGNNTIYISQDLVNSQQSNFSQVVNVLLEEMGHYIDSQINIQDAPGDEGAIFAKLVQNQPLAPGELITLKAEDDHGILNISGQNIAVEHADTPGVFLVDNTGRISIDFLADSGSYHNEMAIFSLENMDSLTPGSADYIKEAARRALSNSTLGHTVIIDINEGAKFVGEIGESNKNDGNYSGLKTFSFTPGDKVAFMLVPEGTVQKVFDNPNPGSSQRPLFSIAAANPNNATQIGQLVPGTFGWEDIRNDQSTDADYNDIIFQIKGASGTLTDIGGLFASGKDWRNLPLAQEIITFASQSNNTTLIAKLSQDTGISNLDIITNNPEISGSVNNADNISKLQAKFSDGSNFVDILSELKANGSFVLNEEKLAQIKGGQIADGDYQLNLRAEDKFGNISEFLVKFTLDTTKPGIPTEVGLKNDGDRVTNQNTPTITGNGENGALIELFDGQNKLGQTTVVNGFWEITTSQITDGLKKLTITATDISGNQSDANNTEFTIDSALPQINITNPQTNAILNPGARLQGTVNGTGSTIDKLSYRFGNSSEINVPVNNQGAFDVELNLTGLSGQQNLIIKAVDLAGNTTTTNLNVEVLASNMPSFASDIELSNDGLFVNETADIGFSVTVKNPSGLTELPVFEVDEQGELIALGSLFDDGDIAKGDEIAGDGSYNNKFTFTPTSAGDKSYTAVIPTTQEKTAEAIVEIIVPITDAQFQAILDFNTQTETQFSNFLTSGVPVDQALAQVKAILEASSDHVKPDSIVTTDRSIAWESQEGILSMLNANLYLDGEERGGVSSTSVPESLPPQTFSTLAATEEEKCNKALVLAPYFWQFEVPNGGDESNNIAQKLRDTEFDVIEKRNATETQSNITIEDFKNLQQYNTIVNNSTWQPVNGIDLDDDSNSIVYQTGFKTVNIDLTQFRGEKLELKIQAVSILLDGIPVPVGTAAVLVDSIKVVSQ